MNPRYLVALVLALSLSAHAEIYKYVDESGHITYTNIPKKGAKKLNLEPLSIIPFATPKKRAAPEDFPTVDRATQKKRDNVRRKLLEEELAREQQRLKQAQQALKEGAAVRLGNERNYQKYLDRVQGLKDNVTLHEKNVAALQKELTGH
jgi:hypothetical protein